MSRDAASRTPRKRSLALVLAIIAASVFGGAMLSASAAPAPPDITFPAPEGGFRDITPVSFVVDTADVNTDVEVWVQPDSGGPSTLFCSATTGGGFDEAVCGGVSTLPVGGYTAVARADINISTDPPVDWSAFGGSIHFIVYNDDFGIITGHPAPTGDSDVTPTFIGTGPAFGTVTLSAYPPNPDNGDCTNIPVDGNGDWGCTWGITPTNQMYDVFADAVDYGGNTITGSGMISFQLREPYEGTVDVEASTTDYKEDLTGTKDVNTARVVVERSPAGLGTWTVYCDMPGILGGGTWACANPSGALGVGTSDLRTTSYNEGGELTTEPGPVFTQVTRTLPGAPVFDSPTPTWTTSDGAESVGGSRDGAVERVVVEIESPFGSGIWLSYCVSSGLPYSGTGWGCSEPDHGLSLGTNNLRATGYTADNISVGTSTTSIDLVDPTELITPAPGGYTNVSAITFTGTSGWEGQFATVLDSLSAVVCDDEVSSGIWTCPAAPLADGVYTFRLSTDYQTRTFESFPFTITVDTVVPGAPSIDGPAETTDRSPTITGSGEPNASVTVYLNGAPTTCASGTPVANGSGYWECTVANSLSADSYAVAARQADRAGNVSGLSATVSLLVVAPAVQALPEPTPTPTPTSKQLKFSWKLDGGGDMGEVHPGDEIVLSASNLPPGVPVAAEFHSKVTALGSTTVGANGAFSLPVTVPLDATAGLHHFVVTVWSPEGEAVVVEQAVMITVPAKATPGVVFDHDAARGGALGDERNEPGAPSSLTHSIHGVGFLIANPVVLCLAAVAALALFLLVAFPAELLNSTISEQYSRFSRRLPKNQWLRRLTRWLDSMPLLGGIVVTLVAAVIFGFADPGFGFDLTSFRLVLSCAIALFIVGYVASAISGRILGGRWSLDTMMELKPLGLILTIVGVVISRLLDFSPGFLLGLILGLSLVGKTTVADRAKSTLVQAGVVFGLSIVGWVIYSVLSGAMDADQFGTALLFDTLVALTAEGLTAVFIGMLPFKFLDGPSVFDYSKKLWAAAFLVSAFAFVAIIIPAAWGELQGSVVVWASVVGAFAVVAVGIYLYFRFWAKPVAEEEDGGSEKKELQHAVDHHS